MRGFPDSKRVTLLKEVEDDQEEFARDVVPRVGAGRGGARRGRAGQRGRGGLAETTLPGNTRQGADDTRHPHPSLPSPPPTSSRTSEADTNCIAVRRGGARWGAVGRGGARCGEVRSARRRGGGAAEEKVLSSWARRLMAVWRAQGGG